MNAKEQYTSANILGVFTTGSLVFAISISEGLSGGFWLYYLVTPLMTLSFFGTFKTRISFGSLLFYTILFLFLIFCYNNGYTDESNFDKYKPMMFANFFVTLTFIFFFTYNFQNISNKAYSNIEGKNIDLQIKNTEIQNLVSALNDRVKNNIQVMTTFGEIDTLTKQAISTHSYTKLYAMRLKNLDLSYKMVYEQKTPTTEHYIFFLNEYAQAVSKILQIPIAQIIVEADQNHKAFTNPKRFDSILVLYSEILLHTVLNLPHLDNLTLRFKYTSATHNLHLEIESTDVLPVLEINLVHQSFAKVQKIDLTSIHTPNTHHITLKLPLN